MKHIGMLVVLVAAIACSAEQPQSEHESSSIQAKITLPSGATITQLSYTLTCTPTPVPPEGATGTWSIELDPNGQGSADGTIGGLDPDSTCTLVLSAQDSWGAAHGGVQNCYGKAEGVQVGSNININLVCYDYEAVTPQSGNITANVTVTEGVSYQCSGIAWYTSEKSYLYGGYGFILNMEVTRPTSPQVVTWSSTNSSASWYQPQRAEYLNTFPLTGNPATDPVTHANPSAQNMTCMVPGEFTVTLTVQDMTQGLLINGQPGLCPASVDTFSVTCQ